MIAFFRRALSSWIVLGLLSVILIAFIVTGVGTPTGLGDFAPGSGWVAKVGGSTVTPDQVERRVKSQLEAARNQDPTLELPAFIQKGGVEQVIDQMMNGRAFAAFAKANGMAASRRLVDAELASIQAFKGPTGSFDRATFLSAIQRAGLTEEELRQDVARDKLANALIVPAAGGARAPTKLVTPFASLLLEVREGLIATIPAAALSKGAPPTDAELNLFYSRNTIRYTVPETRSIRYALIDRSRFEASAKPTDAEIAEAYKARAAEFSGKETRVFTQVVVADQNKAKAIADSARAGTPLAAAAKSAGADAVTLAPQDEKAFAGLASATLATQAFKAAKGSVLDPQKSPFGWSVIRVDTINPAVNRSLDAVRAKLAGELSVKKADAALSEFVTAIEDKVADGATFDEAAKANGLTVVTTPQLTAGGLAPDQPGWQRNPGLEPVLKDAFQAVADDDPSVVTLAPGRAYAFYDLDKVTPAAPRPLAKIREQVVGDFLADRTSKAARKLADAIATKTNGGMPLGEVIAGAGIALPKPVPIGARRIDLTQSERPVPPPVALLFSIAPKKAKVLAAPNNQGWYVVWLGKSIPGNATTVPGLVERTQSELGRAIGDEYVQQLASAIRADQKAKRNDDAIKALKRQMVGAPAAP